MALDDLKYYIIGVILLVAVITGGVMFIGSFSSYDSSLDSSNQIGLFNNSLNKASEVTSAVSEIDSSVKSVSEGDAGILGWLNALVGSVYNGLKAIGSSFGFINTAATDSALMFNVPVALVSIVLLVVVIIIAFAIWTAITKT